MIPDHAQRDAVVPGFFDQLGLTEPDARAQLRAAPRAGLGDVSACATRALHDLSRQFEKLSRLVLIHFAHSSAL